MKKSHELDNGAEEAIERTLAGLRHVEPPAGLENRVLHAMCYETPAAEQRIDTGRVLAWARWAGFGFAAATAVLMISVVLHGRAGSKSQLQLTDAPTARSPEAAARSESSVDLSKEAAPGKAPTRQVRRMAREIRPKQLASFPAPEPPLTEEEKLLQRIARSGNQQQLAVLNPELRAKEEAASEAAFEQFEQNRKEDNTRRKDNESGQDDDGN